MSSFRILGVFVLTLCVVGFYALRPEQRPDPIPSETPSSATPATNNLAVEQTKLTSEIPEITPTTKKDSGDGYGMLSIAGGAVYMGDIKDGVSHGQGKVTYPGGASFEGEFNQGWPHGDGICTYSSGEKQNCSFIMGQRQ